MPKRPKERFKTVTLSCVVSAEDREAAMVSLSNWFYSTHVRIYKPRVKSRPSTPTEYNAARAVLNARKRWLV